MGKRIRIGNDIPISWTLTTGGEAYDLTGKTFEVRMVNLGKVIAVASPAVTGNVLTWTFYGADQRYLGPYDLLFVENPGAHEMVTFDVRAPFVLVAHSWETGGSDDGGVETETVDVSSELNLTAISADAIIAALGYVPYDKPETGIPAEDIASGVIPDVTGKADKVSNPTSGNFAALDSSGNITDSGHKHSDYLTSHQDISGKADKVTGATNGHFAGLDSNGNLTDSGKGASDFGTYSKPSGGIPKTDLASAVQTSLGKADTALQSSDITGKEDKSNKVSSWSGTTTNDHYPSEKLVKDSLDAKQETISDLSDIRSGASAGATAYQKPSGGIPSTDFASAVQTSLGKADSAYQKPSGGIPKTDLASAVQTSLGKADSAYQKPGGGIPASDLASGVIPALNLFIVAVGYDSTEDEYSITNDVTFADLCAAYEAGKGLLLVYTDADGYASEYALSDYAADDDYISFAASFEPEKVKSFSIGSDDSVTYSEQVGRTSALTNDSLFVRGQAAIWKGICATSSTTAAKFVPCSSFTADDQVVGVMVVVTFSNTNAAAPNILTLNVQSRGAKPIKRLVNGGLADIDKPENLTGTMAFIYDGTNWVTWYESFDDIDGNCLDAKFGNVSLHQWKPDYTMTDGSYVKGADGLLYEYSGAKYVEVEVGDAERVRFLGLYPKYSSWTNGWAFGKYENGEWVTIESEKFEYDTSQDASYTKEYIKDVPSGATHFRTSSASSSLYALERQFYLYFQTGEPAVSQEELEDAVNPTIGTTQPNGGFLPNKVYDLGTLTGTETFALAAPTDNTRPNPYHWTFDTGSTAPTVNMPANLTWAGEGTPPTIEANYHYEIFVRNGYASYLAFNKSSQR